jgi:hemerythrin superfamily protein
MPNALDILTADHRKVDGLFAEFESSGDESVAAEICNELTIHTQVEERIVYPELRTLPSTPSSSRKPSASTPARSD